ncbi:MAG: hypothetical protein HY858_13305 [Candidatus Solibacter usitatus]|nr:hypothetical protein [Candidatus Solibacter usitatus]
MSSRVGVVGLLPWLLLPEVVSSGLTHHAQAPPVSVEEARVFKIFTARIRQYVKLQKDVEASLPVLKPTNEVARIAAHQQALARKIAQARGGAHQGDIFTIEVSKTFRRIIREEFLGPEARLARRTIRRDDPSERVVRLHVNDIHPEDIPLTTTPPTLLSKLPQLPKDLAYRIVGRDLTLKDTKAGLIVDLIPNAIPLNTP